MPALVSAGVTKEQLLAVWSGEGETGFTPAQLRRAGVTVAEMQSAGLTLSQMHAGGVSVADLLSAEVSVADLLSAGVSIADLRSGGVNLANLRSAGVTIRELLSAGVTASELRTAGVTIADLRSAGVTTHELYSSGFTIAQMQSAGITISQIHAGGVSTSQLQDADITITQMRNAGLTVSEIYAGGVSIADLLEEDDLTLANLRTGGIPEYTLFNEVCNTPPRSTGTAPAPTITITRLTAESMGVELRGEAVDSITWTSTLTPGEIADFFSTNSIGDMISLGTGTAPPMVLLVSIEGGFVSTLSIPFSLAFSNPRATVTVADGQLRSAMIQLCPAAMPSG